MTMPWPERNLVAEWITMSAPRSMGLHRYGVANVASTTSGSPAAWATSATFGTSSTSNPGLPRISPKTSRVFGLMASPNACGRRGSTNVVSTPNRGSVYSSRLWVPPYSERDATMCSPAPSNVATAKCVAACPLAVAMAPTPPSNALTRSSSTALVGLDRREYTWPARSMLKRPAAKSVSGNTKDADW